jgi:acyl-ACP thioesterase
MAAVAAPSSATRRTTELNEAIMALPSPEFAAITHAAIVRVIDIEKFSHVDNAQKLSALTLSAN